MTTLHGFLFEVYPYVCFAVFLIGSLIRLTRTSTAGRATPRKDAEPRARLLRWGSNLFHVGILFLFFGHLVGLFTPHSVYGVFMSAASKQRDGRDRRGHRGRDLLRRPEHARCTGAWSIPASAIPATRATSPCWWCCGCNWSWAWSRCCSRCSTPTAASHADPVGLGPAHRDLAPGRRDCTGGAATGRSRSTWCWA